MKLPKYSIGIGDRFAHQGRAQLRAVLKAAEQGVDIAPVWNKSHREHEIVGTKPAAVRAEADAAVAALGFKGLYFVDADHVGPSTIGQFIDSSDFFTLDVADFIGRPASDEAIARFVDKHRGDIGRLEIPGLDEPMEITESLIEATAAKFLLAVEQCGTMYRQLVETKGEDAFVVEVSMDETDQPQTPPEMLLILAAIADAGVPAQTIAPRFSGRFNKGVDYVGDVSQFAGEFEQDVAVVAYAVEKFGLPESLKLSVHSGSDKFSIYGPMREVLAKFDAGVHLKTAGTTWLEEIIGLALSGGEALQIAKDVYGEALDRFDELCKPYATVIDIDRSALPSSETIAAWDGPTLAAALRHDQSCATFNPNLRQLLHVGYKVAAEMGPRFLDALQQHAEVIGENVTENLYQRHIGALFVGE